MSNLTYTWNLTPAVSVKLYDDGTAVVATNDTVTGMEVSEFMESLLKLVEHLPKSPRQPVTQAAVANKDYLTEMARHVVKKLPDNYGFILLAFPFGNDPGNRVIYTSNAQRDTAICALKEFLIKVAPEPWLTHVK